MFPRYIDSVIAGNLLEPICAVDKGYDKLSRLAGASGIIVSFVPKSKCCNEPISFLDPCEDCEFTDGVCELTDHGICSKCGDIQKMGGEHEANQCIECLDWFSDIADGEMCLNCTEENIDRRANENPNYNIYTQLEVEGYPGIRVIGYFFNYITFGI